MYERKCSTVFTLVYLTDVIGACYDNFSFLFHFAISFRTIINDSSLSVHLSFLHEQKFKI